MISRSGSAKGKGRSSTERTTVKSAAFAPMPMAMMRTEIKANPGFLRNTREPYATSRASASSDGNPRRSRCAIFACSRPPRLISASRRASSRLSPDLKRRLLYPSRRGFPAPPRNPHLLARQETSRAAGATTPAALSSRLLGRGEKPRQDGRCLLPISGFLLNLLLSRSGQLVILCSAIVLRGAPVRGDVALLLELEQRGIQRSVVEGEQVAAGLLNAPGNAVAMERPQRLQRFQNHQGQRALPYVCLVAHGHSPIALP